MTNGKKLALSIASAADDKKAADILLLNMEKVSPITDYFVICSARNTTQVQAIADNIEDKLAEENVLPMHREGTSEGKWVLLDYGDCIAHVFLEQERNFYNLEQLWADAPSESYAGTED
jgi:ribosome-associated protein